jgi:hypothetical protein
MSEGLWTPPTGVALLRMRGREWIERLPNGKSVRVTVDDSGTVTQVEHDDRLDAIVRPATVTIQIRSQEA